MTFRMCNGTFVPASVNDTVLAAPAGAATVRLLMTIEVVPVVAELMVAILVRALVKKTESVLVGIRPADQLPTLSQLPAVALVQLFVVWARTVVKPNKTANIS